MSRNGKNQYLCDKIKSMFRRKKIKVAVGLSGGVDSSVAALLLSQNKKYQVVGIYMRNWSEQLPGIKGCPWEVDQRDAQLVAGQIGIPFYVVNFEQEYYEMVVQYMIDVYKDGLTPNPDIMCNQTIKFGVFLDKILKLGFDKIATGHYARIEKKGDIYYLKTGLDKNKDQSYFLCRLNQNQLAKTLFPIGELHKPKVREIAKQNNLITANKKDSQGICFIGKVKVGEFLKTKIKGSRGNIVDKNGKVLGKHSGLEFFTIGQRQGIDIGGTGPYYVIDKDFKTNSLTVTNDHDDSALYKAGCEIKDVNWIIKPKQFPYECGIKIRYRHPIISGKVIKQKQGYSIKFNKAQRAVTPGQSAVFYDQDVVWGSGIIKG